MNSSSIDKLIIIDSNFIQRDCKAPYLTSNATGNLPYDLATKSALFNTSNIATTGDVYYRTPGTRENPKFNTSNVVDNDSLATYKWPADSDSSGWAIDSSTSTDITTYKAFDKDITTSIWSSDNTLYNKNTGSATNPAWISLSYPSNVLIKSLSITIKSDSSDVAPKTVKIYGSTDGSTFADTAIDTVSDFGLSSQNTTKTFDVSTTTSYKAFKIQFTTIIGTGDNTDNNSTTQVTVSQVKIITKDAGAWGKGRPDDNVKLDQINFTNVLSSTSNPILEILNNLRICHNLLDDPAKFSTFKTVQTSVIVKKYSIPLNMTDYDNTGTGEITNAMNKIFENSTNVTNLDPNKTSFVAVKRLLKAYEYIIHVYIAMTIETGNTKPITDLILNKLNDENISLNDSISGYAKVQNQIKSATDVYSNRLDTIDNLDIQLANLKEDIVKEKTNKTTNSNILNKNTIVYYVFLLLFIILVCILLYSLQKQEDEKSKIYVGGVLATSIVAMIVIYFLNMTYLKEGFISDTDPYLNLTNYINKYLSDTVNIGLMLDKYALYSGDLLHVVNKEIDRYNGINQQLKLEAAGTKDIQVDDYRNARVLQYRVYLLIQIIIILSVAMFIYLYTGENILLFGIVLLLILFAIYMYIMNTHNMVHTDARKIYWGQPSIIN